MNRKPAYDENGLPPLDAAWFWRHALRPALLILAALYAVAVLAALLSAR